MRFLGTWLLVLAGFTSIVEEGAFTVREDAGIARHGEPVRVGIPVAMDAGIFDAAGLRLLGPRGEEVGAEFRPLTRWDASWQDGRAPIRWMLVDFAAEIDARAEKRFVVVRGDGGRTGGGGARGSLPAVRIAEDSDGILVDTGPARFRFSTGSFDLIDQVLVDRDGDGEPESEAFRGGGGVVVRRAGSDGVFLSAGVAPQTVRVVHRGRFVTEILIAGRLATGADNHAFKGQLDFLECEARWRLFAGSTRARLSLSLTYPERSTSLDAHRGGKRVFQRFDDLSLRFGFPSSGAVRARFGEDLSPAGGSSAFLPALFRLEKGNRVTLYQDSSGGKNWAPAPSAKRKPAAWHRTSFRGFKYLHGTPPSEKRPPGGKRAPGWVRVRGDKTDFWVGVRDFWENFPKAIRVVAAGALEIGLLPGEWSVPHEFRGGWRKTHEILFDFRMDDQERHAGELGGWLRAPLSAFASPEAYRDSFALGYLSVRDDNLFHGFETQADAVIHYRGKDARQGDIRDERELHDLYGWVDYGDSYRAGSKTSPYYGNNELDFSLVMLREYLRRPEHDPGYLRFGKAMARHLMDIDLYHTGRDLFWANYGIRKHDASGIFNHGNVPHTSHFWIGGLSLYYLLTGEAAAQEALHGVSRWLAALEREPKKSPGVMAYSGEVRSRGWILHALVDLYEVTGDPGYLDFASRVLEAMIARDLRPDGSLVGSHRAVDPWMMGYITDALGRYLWVRYRRGERDSTAESTLSRMLEYLRTVPWLEERGIECYRWDPFKNRVQEATPNLSRVQSDGFAYGYLVTGRKEYLDFARKTFHAQDPGGYPYYFSNTLATPAKIAGFRLRFGQAFMTLRELAGERKAPCARILGLRRFPGGRTVLAYLAYSVDRPALCRIEVTGADGKRVARFSDRCLFPGPRARGFGAAAWKERPLDVALTPVGPGGLQGETVRFEVR